MFEYTHKNHLKFGYSNDWYKYEKSPESNRDFTIKFGQCSEAWNQNHLRGVRHLTLFKNECVRAAELIVAKARKEGTHVNICLSGGIDSEIVIRSFMETKAHFNVSIMNMKGNKNLHDISYAIVFCQQHKIKYRIYDVDVEKLSSDGTLTRYSSGIKSIALPYCLLMWFIDQLDGLPILGLELFTKVRRLFNTDYWDKRDEAWTSGKMDDFYKTYKMGNPYDNATNQWEVSILEVYMDLFRYFILYDIKAIPMFFSYTPELIYSYFIDPIITNYMSNQDELFYTLRKSKLDVYLRNFGDLSYREAYNGLENDPIPMRFRIKAFEKYSKFNNHCFKMPFKEFIFKLNPHIWKVWDHE